jgi:hypothetical protein
VREGYVKNVIRASFTLFEQWGRRSNLLNLAIIFQRLFELVELEQGTDRSKRSIRHQVGHRATIAHRIKGIFGRIGVGFQIIRHRNSFPVQSLMIEPHVIWVHKDLAITSIEDGG